MTWRAEALEERAWELTAWRCFWQPWHSAPDSLDSFNWLKLRERAAQEEHTRALEEEHRATLPKTLSDEEVMARYALFCLRAGL